MTPVNIQRAIAAVFVILGGWALAAPRSVIALGLLPEYREGAGMAFAVGCFGAQACIAGLFAATARFTAATFAAYGIMLIGFLGFDLWFGWVDPVFTPLGAALDGIGNVIMIAACWAGWSKLRRD
ncbi:MAG: hypothetical protein ABIN83_03045 [Sphingomicrobium sp.]